MRLLVLSFAFLLAGCGASSSPTRYYVLTPLDTAAPVEKRDVAVLVSGVRLPQYLDRPQIITRGGDNQLQVSDHEQWAGNLRQDMTRVLTENLGRLLGSDRVFAVPHSVRAQPDFRVDVEVLRFERAPDGRVRLAAKWWLSRGDGAVLASPSAELSGNTLGEAGTFEALVASMSAVYNELAVAIAQAIRARAKA
jgi:uncharacterized lipoprotein YmbA